MAALAHAVWNALVKSAADHLLSLTGLNLATLVIGVGLLPFVGLPAPASWGYLLLSGVFHFGYHLALCQAYRHGDFSQVYPIARGAAPILVLLWTTIVLAEPLTRLEWCALGGVLLGILIFASRNVTQVLRDRYALTAALTTAGCIAAYTIADGVGARQVTNVLSYMAVLAILDGVFITVYAGSVRGWRTIISLVGARGQWRIHLLGGSLALLAYSLVVFAMTRAPIPLVSALRETSIIIAALIGAFYFKEPSGWRRIIAALVIFFSVAILALQ